MGDLQSDTHSGGQKDIHIYIQSEKHSGGQKDRQTYTVRETFRRTDGRHTVRHKLRRTKGQTHIYRQRNIQADRWEKHRYTPSDGQKDRHTYTVRETFRRTEGRHTDTHIQTDRRT